MSDCYKLVFRGEVLDGQHSAVVRKRLAAAAGFDDGALDKLFSGRPVVVKREADTATAARFQALFKQAGARLRVLPVEGDDDLAASAPKQAPATTVPRQAPAAPAAATQRSAAEDAEEFELLPAGSDILSGDERTPWQPREIDTGDLAVEGARFLVPDDEPAAAGPDVSHLTVAEPGADLGPTRPEPEHPVQAPDLELGDVGELLAPPAAPAPPAIDVANLEFDVAPSGSDLGQRKSAPPPPAPDTSHLTLE